jgi:hypothetical protein
MKDMKKQKIYIYHQAGKTQDKYGHYHKTYRVFDLIKKDQLVFLKEVKTNSACSRGIPTEIILEIEQEEGHKATEDIISSITGSTITIYNGNKYIDLDKVYRYG